MNINSQWDTLWHNATVATMKSGKTPFGLIDDASIGIANGVIAWVGPSEDVPTNLRDACPDSLDCDGQLVTPGLIDCHTHLIYGGNRVHEFEMRLKGASYEEIAREGGGILATVSATRQSDAQSLFNQAAARLQNFIDEGVTTIEIKSGYGLNLDDELKILRVARRLGDELPVDVVATFLGAHAIPPEYLGDAEGYIDLVCDEILPAVAAEKLADCVDAFCETIAFSSAQVSRVFEVASAHSLPVRLHAEQLSDQKGAVMAARHGALSVDHIEYLAEEDVSVLADKHTVAVLLPGAYYFLREKKLPPINALRKQGVAMAIASDSNPGSAPVGSLLLMLNMACTLFQLTPEESLAGITRNAARALGRETEIGTLEIGKQADMVLWQLRDPAQLSYQIGGNPCARVMYRGQLR